MYHQQVYTEFYENDERLGKVPMYKPFMKIRNIKSVKKNHKCEFCKEEISIGNSCQYWVGIDLGKFYYYRICIKCCEGEIIV